MLKAIATVVLTAAPVAVLVWAAWPVIEGFVWALGTDRRNAENARRAADRAGFGRG